MTDMRIITDSNGGPVFAVEVPQLPDHFRVVTDSEGKPLFAVEITPLSD